MTLCQGASVRRLQALITQRRIASPPLPMVLAVSVRNPRMLTYKGRANRCCRLGVLVGFRVQTILINGLCSAAQQALSAVPETPSVDASAIDGADTVVNATLRSKVLDPFFDDPFE
eukprot:972151-Amphidinium_carterae.1